MKPTLAGQLVWPALVVLVATAVFQAPIFVLAGSGACRKFGAPKTADHGMS